MRRQQLGMTSGPLPLGSYTHIISAGIAYVGDWWIWIVDESGTRISPPGFVHTDGAGGTCNIATIDFYGP